MDAIGRFVADAVLGTDTLWGGDVMCPSGTGRFIADSWFSDEPLPPAYTAPAAGQVRASGGVAGKQMDRQAVQEYLGEVDIPQAIAGIRDEAGKIGGLRGQYLVGLALCIETMWDLAMEVLGKGEPVPYVRCVEASTGRAPEASIPEAKRELVAELLGRAGYATSGSASLLGAVDAWRRDRLVPMASVRALGAAMIARYDHLRAPGSSDVYASLTNTHHSFETPCGSYAHFKLTRYLLRVTRDVRYGDSMERMMYNTVLGAKPLQDNGEAFYYSDYNFDGKRVYKEARWPCCSGTLPQVAADYRINTYFRGPQAVYVNLYVPSTLRWTANGVGLSLMQEGEYPYEDHVTFTVTSSLPTELTLHFRIPAWAEGASVFVNGTRQKGLAVPGQFVATRREWKTGDRVELELPLKIRLETIDARHTDAVALLRGPLVLMAVKKEQDGPVPKLTREQLLAAQRVSERQWQVISTDGPVKMLPFTSVGDLPYTTYVKVG